MSSNNSNNKIPFNIFQTWESKKLPIGMKNATNDIIKNNPEFKYFLYDDNDCLNFIDKYYNYALHAYKNLIPGAYKADLWRYCILHKFGGIYLDIKFVPVDNFKFINLMNNEYFVRDLPMSGYGIYNAFMIVKPNNIIMKKCIDQIIYNVNNKYYGLNSLAPTGPMLLKNYLDDIETDLYLEKENNNHCIYYKDKMILKSYNGYRNEQEKFGKKKHYGHYWNEKNIYYN